MEIPDTLELTPAFTSLVQATVAALRGAARRLFMARVVRALGPGGQTRAEQLLGWNRGTIRKGTHELQHGLTCQDAFAARGRKRAEEHLPHLLRDIRCIVDAQSQADPQFHSARLYTRLSAAEVRRQLMAQYGYSDAELPTVQTLTTKLNELGYCLRTVAKTQPQKKYQPPMRSSPRSMP